MPNIVEKSILDLIKKFNRILILPSSPLDGDSVGTALALSIALQKMEKEVTVACSEEIPDLLKFFPSIKGISHEVSASKDFIITINCEKAQIDKIKKEEIDDKVNLVITPKIGSFTKKDVDFSKGESSYDLIITVDTAELPQLKGIYEDNIEMFHEIPVINIDHHISNSHFAKINYVDIMASSTAELVVPLLEKLSKETKNTLIDENVATLLLAGIITDTGSFQNSNTTPKSFKVAAKLVSYGARQQEIIQHIYKTKQLTQLKLWGRVLSKIQTDKEHRIVWSSINEQDIRDTKSTIEEAHDVIDELLTNAPGAEVVLLFKGEADLVSVSIRTTTPAVDASKIAANFGGGGHTQAAGFERKDKSLIDVEYQTLEHIRKLQKERLGLNSEENETSSD